MTRNISKFGLLLLTVVITLTCSSPLVPVLGTVVLDFSSGSRAVGIPAGLTTFNVEVKAPDMATITVRLTAPDLSTVIELPSGADRQFYVTAADSAGKIRYQGKAQLEVVPGATHDLDITMSPVFRVNYLATGAGSGLAPVDAGLYSAGDSATVLGNSGNLTKAGYTFAGWNTAEDGSGTAYAVGSTVSLVDADINLYPRWIPVPYSISYVLNGGVNATGNPATYTIEDTEITLLPPEPWSPYTFLGWYTDTNYITKVISIPTGSTGNRTLYALWDTPTYIVSYDAQGGTTATPPTTSVTYGQIYGALATTSRVGYSFSGWFTEPLGAGTQIFETTTVTITANQTLYAHWVEETYTISYVLNGAPDNGGNPSSYTVSSNITLTAPSWAPYIFEGWYTDAGFTVAKTQILPGETGDITLYAQWAAPTYIVSYDAQGGTTATPPTTSVTYGQTYGTLATTSRVGYSFVGWFTETLGAGTQIFDTTTVTITANQTLFAHWVEETYTISYVLNGSPDNGGNPSSYTVSSNITLTAPSWAPYIFEGWYTDAGFTVAKTQILPGETGDITLYAQWAAPTYIVSYDAQGGTTATPPTTNVTYGQTYGTLATTSRVGYSFVGWFTETLGAGTQIFDTTTVTITANQTLFAHWVEETYTISYVLNGSPDNGGNPSSYTVSSNITLMVPSWAPYIFEGWYTDAGFTVAKTQILAGETGAIILYAQWSAPSYTVSYDAQGGTTATPPTTSVTYGQTYGTLATTSRVGYSFVGWFTETLGAGTQIFDTTTVAITANQILYAHWVPMVYPISFDAQGGDPAAPSMINVTYNQTYGALATTSRVGYTFNGWWTGPNGTGVEVIDTTLVNITAPQTLYAHWVPMVYLVSFDAQGGDPAAPSMINVTYNQTYSALATTSRVGYTFSGWWTGPNGTGVEVIDTTPVTITAPQTLYAFWIPISYPVTYNINGAPDNGGNPISYTIETPTIFLLEPVYSGFFFLGWFTTPSFIGGTDITEITMGSTSSITLYAKWVAAYTMTFDPNGGTGTMSPQTMPSTVLWPLDLNTYTFVGKTFDGWDTDPAGVGTRYADGASYMIGATNETLYAQWLP